MATPLDGVGLAHTNRLRQASRRVVTMTGRARRWAWMPAPVIIGAALVALGCDAANPISTDAGHHRAASAARASDASVERRGDSGVEKDAGAPRRDARAPAQDVTTSVDFDDQATCDMPVCGDGQVTGCAAAREACDGEDLRGLGCGDFGFARGTLGCSQECALDTSKCQPCEDDARITGCTSVDTLPGYAYGLGLAWRDGVLLIATAIGGEDAIVEGASHPVRLLSLDGDLHELRAPHELEPKEAWIGGLVAVSDGFLLSYVDGYPGRGAPLYSQHLDAQGEPDGAPVLHAGLGLGVLVARPDGGPLLVANPAPSNVIELPDGGMSPPNPPRAGDAVSAVLLDEQGAEVWSAATGGVVITSSGAYTGDGFVFATQSISPFAFAVQHVALDGTVTPDAWSIPPVGSESISIYDLQVAWDGTNAWLAWSDGSADRQTCSEIKPVSDGGGFTGGECDVTPSELRWAKLDHNGAPVDGPGSVSGVVRSPSSWIASGEDRVLVSGFSPTSTVGEASGLRVQHIDETMQPTGQPVPLTSDSLVQRFGAVFGPDGSVFVAFTHYTTSDRTFGVVENGLLGVAKVAP